MGIAILETGQPPEALIPRFGRYPAMFRALIGAGDEVVSYDVAAGELPADPAMHDAYMITGSPAGVYDPLPWIGDLIGLVRAAPRSTKFVGICFGHQLLAQALGGDVTKSDKGWGVGLHDYRIVARQDWMDDAQRVSIPASHQDQVVVQPPATIVTAASDFTPLAGLAWTDRPAISFQFHPEFDGDYATALLETRLDRIPNAREAMASFDRRPDNGRVAGWIDRFLRA